MSDSFDVASKFGPIEHSSSKIPALGLSWANAVTMRLMLSRTGQYVTVALHDSKATSTKHCNSSITPTAYQANVRKLRVLFAPHLPNSMCHFIVDEDGVKGLPSNRDSKDQML